MLCPLSALANIATMTAAREPPIPQFDTSTSFSAPLSAIAAASTEQRSCNTETKTTKKRSLSAANSNTANHHTNGRMYHTKPNKKAKKTTTYSETRREAAATTSKMKANQSSFPVILMAIMSAPQNKEFITFLTDEQSFIIFHPQAMVKIVLPIHFEENAPTFDQFLYLLEIWGFEAVKDPQYPGLNVFKHPMFRKGDWEACLQMEVPREEGNITPKNQAVDNPPTDYAHAPLAYAEQQQPPSPPRELYVADAAVSAPTTARSVTPPENITLSPSGMLQYQAAADPSMTQDSSASQWMMPTAMLDKMIMATAETRRRLPRFGAAITASSSLEELAINYPELQSVYHQGMSNSSAMRYPNVDAASAVFVMPRTMGRKRPPSFALETELTDAQVQLVTNDVVSAAMAALNGTEQHRRRHHAHSSNNADVLPVASSSHSHLNAMTEAFLERSNARRLQSRPAGILGLSSSMTAQTRALLAKQRQG